MGIENESPVVGLAAGTPWRSWNHNVWRIISQPQGTGRLVPAGFVPEGEFNSIPQSKFVVNDAQVIFYNMLSRTHGFRDFMVLESFSDQRNHSPLSLIRNTFSVALSQHTGPPTLKAFKPSFARSYDKKISFSLRED